MMLKVVQILLLFAQGLPDCGLDVVDNVLLQVSSALVEDKEVHEDAVLNVSARAAPMPHGRLMPHEDGSSSLQIARENTSHGGSGPNPLDYLVFPAGRTRCSASKDDADDPGNS